MFRDPDTGELRNGIAEVRYSHAAMIELLVLQPAITQNELASHFGRTPSWISQIIRSDAFQAALEARKEEVYSPLVATFREKLEAVASASLDRILERVTHPALPPSDKFVIESAKLAASALGYGAKPAGDTNVSVVIQVPQKAPSESAWGAKYAPSPGGVSEATLVGEGTPSGG